MLARLVTGCERERYRSIVVSMTVPGAVGPLLDRAEVEWHTLGMRRGMADWHGATRLFRLLRELRPEILQTWLYHADLLGLLAQLRTPPFILFWNIRCTETVGVRTVRKILSWCSAKPDAVIVNSLAGRRFHEQIGYRPRRWEHIPNGCDTSLFKFNEKARRDLRRELGIADEAIVVGLPARHHPMKDHATFLAAAARLAAVRPEAVFLLIGQGVDRSNRALRQLIEAHGIAARVKLLGERADMPDVYPVLDIATLSSAFGEGCPNVLIEAMSCGVPCVATDCGDAAEILGPTGTVVPLRNPEPLTAAWERLISLGSGARRSMGEEARQRIARSYDLQGIVGRYDALYSEFLAQYGAADAFPATGRRHRQAAARSQ